MDEPWMDGAVTTPTGEVPRAFAVLSRADHIGSWKARWGVGRMHYRVEPGLYAVGCPTAESPVLVSANYKLSFDHLRAQLTVLDAWILVLDTKGINVWCAAGKGTFGTDEIVRRAEAARLGEVVSHRRLVVPQLGAPGVSAHEVKERSGFRVVYGPVRADDLRAFLDSGMKATPEMRRVRFPFRDRVALIPVELVMGAKHALLIAVGFLVLAGLGPGIYSFERAIAVGARSAGIFLAVAVAGVVLTPMLLPWLPGRAFAVKGLWLGLALAAGLAGWAWVSPGMLENGLSTAAWFLMIPAVASFVAMNFTGASTYTSLSGVRREMRVAVPAQAICAVLGAGLWLVGRFF
jgi:acetyl-CoA decarbonylase/synthase complex subunit gamma